MSWPPIESRICNSRVLEAVVRQCLQRVEPGRIAVMRKLTGREGITGPGSQWTSSMCSAPSMGCRTRLSRPLLLKSVTRTAEGFGRRADSWPDLSTQQYNFST
jgi:hypothetical protein